jgi:hypothetical protein
MPEKPAPYTLASDDKVAKVMVYTENSLYWGNVVVKTMIRIGTWLRTNAVPDRITLYDARGIVTTSSVSLRPNTYSELNVAVNHIQVFHLMPPAKEPVDYDPTEPNRRMESVSALVGTFIINGNLRLSTSSNLRKHLEVNREIFTSLYDTEITNLILPSLGTISVPSVLVRQESTIFAKQ